jgi:hypothetical protein
MSAKKRQTFEKMNRERAVKEKRARKQEKKEQRKLARAGMNGDGDGDVSVVEAGGEQPIEHD